MSSELVFASFLDELEKISQDAAIPRTVGNDFRELGARYSSGVPLITRGTSPFQRPAYTALTAQAAKDARLGRGGFTLPSATSTEAARAATTPAATTPATTPVVKK